MEIVNNLTTSSAELMFLTTTANNLSRKLKWGTASSKLQMQRMATRWKAGFPSRYISFSRYACKCTKLNTQLEGELKFKCDISNSKVYPCGQSPFINPYKAKKTWVYT